MDNGFKKRLPYECLVAYQLGLITQELTEQFTKKWIKSFRRRSQMDETSRSNPQNVAEGHTQESLKGYIKLAGIARGSNEELQNDYRNFLLKNGHHIWSINHEKIREFRVKWISQNTLNTPNLPNHPEEAANMLLTFCRMEGLLLRNLVDSLKEKHRTEGGLTENLYKRRKSYRGYQLITAKMIKKYEDKKD